MNGPTRNTLEAISDEVIRARKKFPGRRFLLAACLEELGELAKAYLQREGSHRIRKEAIQVACLAIRIIEEGDECFDNVTDDEAKPGDEGGEEAVKRRLFLKWAAEHREDARRHVAQAWVCASVHEDIGGAAGWWYGAAHASMARAEDWEAKARRIRA